MNEQSDQSIVVHALRVKQPSSSPLLLFALTAEQLERIASVTRASRRNQGELEGYQRSIAAEHVSNIADYLNSPSALMPNAVIVALSSAVRFDARRGPGNDDGSAIAGKLLIPVPRPGDAAPAWIVDGQQRTAALARVADRSFPIPMAGFVTDSVDLQRDQFIRVNSVRPLDKALVTELLPELAVPISPRLSAKKVPSALVELLDAADDSPFKGMIRRPSSESKDRQNAPVQDTSLVAAIQESLSTTSGCLFPYRNLASGHTDHESIWWYLVTFWSSVRDAFPVAWGLPPNESRLMHGCGIRAMGRLMDRMMASAAPFSEASAQRVRTEMQILAPHCHWTDGAWPELNGLPWNELQNTPQHIRMLSNALIRSYLHYRPEPS